MEVVTTTAKTALRRRLLAARRAVPESVHAAEAAALHRHLAALPVAGATVCAYVPVGTEPGAAGMLDALLERNLQVLLPLVDGDAAPLRWGRYRPGTLVTGRFGLLEPPGPGLPATALGDADLILVPAVAVDRRGVRLGRGGGFYDRSLPLRDPHAALVAVVRDAELLAEVPAEPHDVRMSHALTPDAGLVDLSSPASGIGESDSQF